MEHFINEKTVMQFYLDELDSNKILFLQEKEESKAKIRSYLEQLLQEEKMNNKIAIACNLWKALFEAAMSYVNPNNRGRLPGISHHDKQMVGRGAHL